MNNLTTQQKALAINLEAKWYGSLAEIGAGQKVAQIIKNKGLFGVKAPRML